MTALQNALAAVVTLVIGPAAAEFFASHGSLFLSLIILGIGALLVYSVHRSNQKDHAN